MMRINVWKVFVKLAKSRFALALATLFACVWQASAVQWDMTRFEYEPGTGRLARKVYPDGKAISYTYYCEGLPKRITQASGKWMERGYDSRLNVTSKVYSSENTPDVHVVPNEFGTPIRVASRERPVGHLSVDGAEKGRTTFNYDGNGKISQMVCVNAAGFLKMEAPRLT